MVIKKDIQRNLQELDCRYQRKSSNPRDPMYYSKLALIELCGWIEISMDTIVLECAGKYLTGQRYIEYVEKDIVKKTYSFTYNNHFRFMLIQVVGILKVEELEGLFDQRKFLVMKSTLGSLKKKRDQEAHTFIENTTPNLHAPSRIRQDFQNVYEGLKDVEKCVHGLSF